MEKLVIDRQEWAREHQDVDPDYRAWLKNTDEEKYCCLGLMCRDVLGIEKEMLEGNGEPSELYQEEIDEEQLEFCDETEKGRLIEENKTIIAHNKKLDKYVGEDGYKYNYGDIMTSLMNVNDRYGPKGKAKWRSVTDEQQEELIRIGFRELGIEVEFIN